MIAAGSFTKVGALDASRIARWNGTAWRALGTGAPGMVTALAHDATKVYISTYDEGNGRLLLGAFDGTTWSELATPDAGITPVSYFNFNALRVLDERRDGRRPASAWLDADTDGRGALDVQGWPLHAARRRRAGGSSGIAATSDAIWVAGSIVGGRSGGQRDVDDRPRATRCGAVAF